MKPKTAMTTTVTLTTLCAATVLSLAAAAEEAGDMTGREGRQIGVTIFETMDVGGDGLAHMGDLEVFRGLVFTGMDGDENGTVSYTEFSSWDPGFAYLAEKTDRADAYTTASKIVFAFWDRNGDGDLTEREMRRAMNDDFRRADIDDDALLTKAEFIAGFPIMLAMRAALRPDL